MATVLCLDVPAGTQVGIDLNSWKVGDRFQGITGVPPGAHYLYFASSDDDGALVSGLFLYVARDDHVWVGRWSTFTEQILPLTDIEEIDRYRNGVRQHDFDYNLGRYPMDILQSWTALSNHIDSRTIARLAPINSLIVSSTAPGGEESTTDVSRTYFTDLALPRTVHEPGKVTAVNLDRSSQFEELIAKRFAGNEALVLGELQFAFVAFVLGQSFDAFDQWKTLIRLLCSCERALCAHSQFFADFIDTLRAQVDQAPAEFFTVELTSNNFLHRSLSDLFELGQDTGLKDRLQQFRLAVESKFHCLFSTEPILNDDGRFDPDDEDAPAIVEL